MVEDTPERADLAEVLRPLADKTLAALVELREEGQLAPLHYEVSRRRVGGFRYDENHRKVFLFLGVLATVLSMPRAARGGHLDRDDAQLRADLEAYFGRARKGELEPDEHGVRVTRIAPDLPASRSELRVGDRILAVDGLRVYGVGEYHYVRFMYDPYATDYRFVVARGGRLDVVLVGDLVPPRRGGFGIEYTGPSFAELLEELGVEFDPTLWDALGWFPRRPAWLLKRWLDQMGGRRKDLAWLREFVELYGRMVRREWNLVKPPAREPPLDYFARLARFYLSIAERNRAGEEPPDPAAHGEGFEFYVFNYPYPDTVAIPPVGKLDLGDADLERLVRLRHDDPGGSREERRKVSFSYGRERGQRVEGYIADVKRALLNHETFGAYPWKGPFMKRKGRQEMIDQLYDRLEGDEGLFYAVCLVGPLVTEGRGEEALELTERIRARSPYLAYVVSYYAIRGAQDWNEQEAYEAGLRYYHEYFNPPPGETSVFYRHILDRDRRLAKRFTYEWEWKRSRLSTMLAGGLTHVARALGHEHPPEEEARLLDAAVARDDFAEGRAELYRRAVKLAKVNFMREDYERLKRLNRDGEAYGLLLDALGECLYWEGLHYYLDKDMAPWTKTDMVEFAERADTETYPRVCEALRSVRWDEAAAVAREVKAVYGRSGWLVSTLAIADALQEHGHTELARHYRAKVLLYHRSQTEYLIDWTERWENESRFFLHALRTLCCSKATSAAAVKQWRRYVKDRPKDERQESDLLHLARAYLHLDRPGDAVEQLIASARAAHAPGPYVFGGRVSRDPDEYREHLLRLVAAHEGFTEDMKGEIKRSPLAHRMRTVVEELFGKVEVLPPLDEEEEVF